MSIGWIAEDIAELTGAVIGAYDFPTLYHRKPSRFHQVVLSNSNSVSSRRLMETFSLLQQKKASSNYLQRAKSLLDDVNSRIADCLACEMPLIKLSVDHQITSATVHQVIQQAKEYFAEKKDALYDMRGALQAGGIYSATSAIFKPSMEEVNSTIHTMMYVNTSVRLLTSSTANDPFWRVKDDLKQVTDSLGQSNLSIEDYLIQLCGMRKSYVKCDNCGMHMLEIGTGKLFPYCVDCGIRRES